MVATSCWWKLPPLIDLEILPREHTLPITLIPDLPPQVSINPVPAPGDIYAGQTIRVNYTASDEGAITKVMDHCEWRIKSHHRCWCNHDLDSRMLYCHASLEDGAVVFIKARATDDSGKSTSTPEVSYTIVPDTTPPTITLIQPTGGFAEVTEGDRFLVSATATDLVGVARVEMSFNGLNVH